MPSSRSTPTLRSASAMRSCASAWSGEYVSAVSVMGATLSPEAAGFQRNTHGTAIACGCAVDPFLSLFGKVLPAANKGGCRWPTTRKGGADSMAHIIVVGNEKGG